MEPVDVTQPLIALARGLDEAFGTPGSKQNQFAAALAIMAVFLRDAISIEHANSFFELSSAFANLKDGTIHPWLKPPKSKRRRDPSQLWRARASAVVALEALCATGMELEAAARELLRKNPSIAFLGGGKLKRGAGPSTIINWHKEFSSDRVEDAEAKELFSAGRDLIQTFSGNTQKLRDVATNRARAAAASAGVFSPHSNTR